ncbi:hypothetical protein JW935_10105 [candidate division KSB1 bacterium]|nr:hypothetical protein [candidate division KSB1 bacterium]
MICCDKNPVKNNHAESWQEFIKSGEEYVSGDNIIASFASLTLCDKAKYYAILNDSLFIGVSQLVIYDPEWDENFMIEIKNKSGDYEYVIAKHGKIPVDERIFYVAKPIFVIFSKPIRKNYLLETNIDNDSLAIRVQINKNKYRIAMGPILKRCE